MPYLRGMSDPITTSEQRLQEYLSRLTAVLGHADRTMITFLVVATDSQAAMLVVSLQPVPNG